MNTSLIHPPIDLCLIQFSARTNDTKIYVSMFRSPRVSDKNFWVYI